ncbi:MAG: helix-turn-helix domain-containing protein [Candidatus Binataceae bacterium]
MKAIQGQLGRRVRALRTERGWTQEELAAKAKKHPTYIGGIERGERNPTLIVLADIARAFGAPLSILFEEDGG